MEEKLFAVLVIIICFISIMLILFIGAKCVIKYCIKPDVTDSLTQRDAPCVKCQLIDMGEMACYTGFCPGCGRVPPSKRAAAEPATALQLQG